ncbi:MAG: hypothetical protein IPG23_11745 [Burkholderiales bacterium]|nr:hypothetical protein [Burkholderiales bacterium]
MTDKPMDGGSVAVFGGVMSGVLTGLAADLLAGGLTLGTGALVGGGSGCYRGALRLRATTSEPTKTKSGWLEPGRFD